jgi:hypothetical protein
LRFFTACHTAAYASALIAHPDVTYTVAFVSVAPVAPAVAAARIEINAAGRVFAAGPMALAVTFAGIGRILRRSCCSRWGQAGDSRGKNITGCEDYFAVRSGIKAAVAGCRLLGHVNNNTRTGLGQK